MKFLTYIKLAIELLPQIIALVKLVETEALPAAAAGKEKLKFVLDVIRASYAAAAAKDGQPGLSLTEVLGLVTFLIEKFVGLMNALGIFSSGKKN